MSIFSNEHRETAFHVRDCYVWSEIHYLDSLTNYREYLPPPVSYSNNVRNEDLVLRDSSSHLPTRRHLPLRAFLALLVVIGLLLWYEFQ